MAFRPVVSVLVKFVPGLSTNSRPCGRPEAALRPGNDTTVTGKPASPQPEVGDGRAVGTWPFSPSNGRVGFDLVEAVVEFGAGVLVFGSWCS